jgi:hypothetical protein
MPRIPSHVQKARGHSRLTIVAVVAAMVVIGVASLYMVQMPGNLSGMLAGLFTF